MVIKVQRSFQPIVVDQHTTTMKQTMEQLWLHGTELQIRHGIAPGVELYVYRLSEDFDHDEVCDALHDVLDHI